MKFVLHATALNGDDTILVLIDRLADEVHRVEVLAADLLRESDWFRQARPTRQALLMNAVATPLRSTTDECGPHLTVVEIKDAETARRAEKLAHTPLVILVEDRESGGVLLDILVEVLGWPTLRKVWKRGREATPQAAEINTAGGFDAIPQRVERAASDAEREDRPLRMFVLCARWPGDDSPALTRRMSAVRQACETHGVPYHVWEKRCAENYIPDEVFKTVRDDPRNRSHVERFSALLRRSPTQRDYFPIKDGLKAKERAEAVEAGLYDSHEVADLILLEGRLLPKRPRPLKLLHEERRASFTAESLRQRDGAGELDTFLRDLAKEL